MKPASVIARVVPGGVDTAPPAGSLWAVRPAGPAWELGELAGPGEGQQGGERFRLALSSSPLCPSPL